MNKPRLTKWKMVTFSKSILWPYFSISFLLILFLHSSILSGQVLDPTGENSLKGFNIDPVSPEVYAFQKYGEIPVSTNKGVPSISVPIYTIEQDGVSVPIHLSYHSGGIKVDEIATRVGLGWSLNAGGNITIQKHGLEDLTNFSARTLTAYTDLPVGEGFPTQEGQGNCYTPGYPNYCDMEGVYEGDVDGQPDIFSYNFGNYSGSFFFDSSFNIVQMQPDGLTIAYNAGAFTFTDPYGNKYYFQAGSYTMPTTPPSCYLSGPVPIIGGYTSGFDLTKIVTAKGNEIVFTYRSLVFEYVTGRDQREFVYSESYGPSVSCESAKPQDYDCLTTVQTTESVIDRITFSGGKIDFIHSDEDNMYVIDGINEPRRDLSESIALRKVSIKDPNNTEVKHFKLDYDYFVSVNGHTDEENYRLKLLGIKENGQIGHSFDYFEDAPLPKRLSFAQDLWGFYNGETNNPSLLPTGVFEDHFYDSGANREVGEASDVRLFTLKRLTYPTQGYSEFDFENNYSYFNGYESSWVSESSAFSSNDFVGFSGTHTFTTDSNYINDVVDPKVIISNECDNTGGGFENDSCIIRLFDDNSSLIGQYTGGGTYDIPITGNDLSSITIEINKTGTSGCFCNANVVWQQRVENYIGDKKIGGLRIASISNYDDMGGMPEIVNYSYEEPGTSHTSGKSYDFVQNYLKLRQAPTTSTSAGGVCVFKIRQSSSVYSLLNHLGSAVGYQYITEERNNGDVGKKVYEYEIDPDDGANSLEYVVAPQTSFSWKRGHLINQFSYNASGALVQETNNEYVFSTELSASISDDFISGDYIGYGYTVGLLSFIGTDPVLYGNPYRISGAWKQLKSTTTKDYTASGTLVQTVEYEYDNHYNLLPTTITTEDSKGVVTIQKDYFPDDITSQSTLLSDVLSSADYNAISQLKYNGSNSATGLKVQSEVYRDYDADGQPEISELLRIDRNLYGIFSNASSGNMVLLKDYLALKGNLTATLPSLTREVTVSLYTENGNVAEYSRENGPMTTVLWGYEGKYPIAKLENITASNVVTALSVSSVDDLDENDLSAIGALRSDPNFSNVRITTYDYNPLVGITSMTDSRGETSSYEYDTYNRLKMVKDRDGKILEDYLYHFKGQ